MKTLVNNKTTDDASKPALGTGIKTRFGGRIEFYPEISAGGSATFTILWKEGTEYRESGPIACTSNQAFWLEISPTSELNCYTTGVTGTVSLKTR